MDDELALDAGVEDPPAEEPDEVDGEERDEMEDELGPIPGALFVPIDVGCGGVLLDDCVKSNKGDPVMDRL